jgi:hypothetical protein
MVDVPEPGVLILSLIGVTAVAWFSLPFRKESPPRNQI